MINGDCPKGADAICKKIWIENRLPLELYPADWEKHGKRAGFVRNAQMVESGADVCLAFIKDGSKGATMTADLAENAGIRTVRYER
jgi:DNA-binding transcriptional regulator PaaX